MKPEKLNLPLRLWREMREQVSAATPREACGLIAGRGDQAEGIYPISNALNSPVRFRMDPYEQLKAFEAIEESGLELVAIYHSHPRGPEIPSQTDIEEARYEAAALIWSPRGNEWQARAFWLDETSATEIPLDISVM